MSEKDLTIIFKIIPLNSPELCGKCKTEGDSCYCDCHKQAIFAGYHESCYSMPLNIPPLSDEVAEAMGYVSYKD